MQIKSLDTLTTWQISDVFIEAFADYVIKMPTDHDYYENRWRNGGINFDRSYGMFDGEQLIGFILIAIDERFGEKIAYNGGTGVIPSHRGQRIVQQLYDHALPIYKNDGVDKCTLEVITSNKFAIKAYQNVGMKITRTLKGYKGELQSKGLDFDLEKVKKENINWESLPNQHFYSWDFQPPVVKKSDVQFFDVSHQNRKVGYFIIDDKKGRIHQMENYSDSMEDWHRIFDAMRSLANPINIINIDDRLISKIQIFEEHGLENMVNQYEMEVNI